MIGCCENIAKLNICFCSCDEGITLPMLATASGNWMLVFEFAGTMRRYRFSAFSGEPLVIPNKFNESYNHNLKLYKPDGTLFNDTCYSLQTIPTYCDGGVIDAEGSTNPEAMITAREVTLTIKTTPDVNVPTHKPEGVILQDDVLKGKTPWNFIIIDNANLQWKALGITFNSVAGTFDFTAWGSLNNNSIVTIPYNETIS